MVNIECPQVTECLSGELVISDMTPWIDLHVPEVPNCGSVSWSQMNLRFQAKSKSLSLDLTFNDSGDATFKLGIVDGCIPYGTCVAFESCELGNFPSIDVDDLVVGHEYIIFVDECGGYETPFELVINPGSDDPFEAIIDIGLNYKDCSFIPPIPNQFCAGTPIEWIFELEDETLYNSFSRQEATYNISIDGPEVFEYAVDNYRDFSFTINNPGDYVLCLESVDFACESYDIGICKEFSIEDWHHDYGVYEVCQHDLEQGWVPDSDWVGEEITEEGFFDGEYNFECGCPYYESINVIQLNEVVENVEIELCPDDYPFVYFDDYEFDYSQFDIEENLDIFRESLQRDYNNEKCDSLVNLILINENPEDRCSSCELPISLEKSKIVYCIPFDNEAIDVSGKRNRVNAVGVAFDDNGSSSNILWEAVFDGNEDYVTLPHIDDLNTSVFSFNFQFNKDDSFDNGNTETLISKGDAEKDNLRFDVSIIKVNESIFDLVSTFYTSDEGVAEIILPDLQIFKWFDVAYVVETDSIGLYLDGYLYDKVAVNSNLKGNDEDMHLGTLINSNARTQFYNGRLDNFKYWKQKLSGQDVLFLHFPEKEFEVEQSYFLSCCEEAEFRDVVIDINNQLDSVIVPNASPTGYDSLYILNYIQADSGPQINLSIAPQDVTVQYQQQCQEFCQSTVDWSTDLSKLFTDNCGIVNVTQSHPFQVTLDENVSYLEVIISGTDNCGQSTTYTFDLELECLPSNVIEVPEQNEFEIISNGDCVSEDDEICIYSDIELYWGFINSSTNALEPYADASGFTSVVNINGIAQTYSSTEITDGIVLNQFEDTGIYTICLESVSNFCETIESDFCQTIKLRESSIIDHGQVTSCSDNLESTLPSEVSSALTNLILSNPQQTTISVSENDACGCQKTEMISLIINESTEEELFVVLCEGDIYDGKTEDEMYTIQLLSSQGCDSILYIDLTFLPNTEVMVFAEICEGESYEGYTEEGTYEEKFIDSNGCDSTLTLQLSVLPKSYDELFVEICPDSTFMGFNQTGVYEIVDTNILGCDSIITLELIVLDVMDPACFVSSINEVSQQINIYPNPVSEVLTIDYDQNCSSAIFDVNGLKVATYNNIDHKVDVSQLTNGIYFIKIQNENKTLTFHKFIKL